MCAFRQLVGQLQATPQVTRLSWSCTTFEPCPNPPPSPRPLHHSNCHARLVRWQNEDEIKSNENVSVFHLADVRSSWRSSDRRRRRRRRKGRRRFRRRCCFGWWPFRRRATSRRRASRRRRRPIRTAADPLPADATRPDSPSAGGRHRHWLYCETFFVTR